MAEQERKVEELKRSELIEALEQSRQEISADLLDVRDSLSLKRRVSRSIGQHPGVWLGVSALAGFILARPLLSSSGTGEKGKDRSVRVAGALTGLTTLITKNFSKVALPILSHAVSSYFDRRTGPKGDKEISQDT